jgi:thiosulfate reductase cytochrome b subunit
MFPVQSLSKMLVLFGGIIALTGLVMMFSDKIPFIGRLPGDISIKNDNFQLYFPITTGVIVSLIVSLILWVISYLSKK